MRPMMTVNCCCGASGLPYLPAFITAKAGAELEQGLVRIPLARSPRPVWDVSMDGKIRTVTPLRVKSKLGLASPVSESLRRAFSRSTASSLIKITTVSHAN